MPGNHRQRTQDFDSQVIPMSYERAVELLIGRGVGSESFRRCLQTPVHENCCSVVKRMGERNRRLDPREAVLPERQGWKNGEEMPIGCTAEPRSWMKARESHFARPSAASWHWRRFSHFYGDAVACQMNGRGETVWTAADYDSCSLHTCP